MALFVLKPDPDNIAKRSLEFFERESRESEARMATAAARLDDAQRVYDAIIDPGFNAESVLSKAEETFEEAERLHGNNTKRIQWELRRDWMKKIISPKNAMPVPWRDWPAQWFKCFFRRK